MKADRVDHLAIRMVTPRCWVAGATNSVLTHRFSQSEEWECVYERRRTARCSEETRAYGNGFFQRRNFPDHEILRKRESFRAAFAQFDPQRIARFDSHDVERLMRDAGIVRNRAKIEATIRGAQAWIGIQERGGFSQFCWKFVDGYTLQPYYRTREDVPAETDVSRALSKALKQEGFGFCGPTIVYAFMQAVGMTNDHLVDCCRHGACLDAGRGA